MRGNTNSQTAWAKSVNSGSVIVIAGTWVEFASRMHEMGKQWLDNRHCRHLDQTQEGSDQKEREVAILFKETDKYRDAKENER